MDRVHIKCIWSKPLRAGPRHSAHARTHAGHFRTLRWAFPHSRTLRWAFPCTLAVIGQSAPLQRESWTPSLQWSFTVMGPVQRMCWLPYTFMYSSSTNACGHIEHGTLHHCIESRRRRQDQEASRLVIAVRLWEMNVQSLRAHNNRSESFGKGVYCCRTSCTTTGAWPRLRQTNHVTRCNLTHY